MNKLSLRILLMGALGSLASQLGAARPPQNVSYKLEEVAEDSDPSCLPDELDVVLVTSDIELLRQASVAPPQHARMVFVGAESELVAAFGTTPAFVLDVWSPDGSAAQVACRFERLLSSVKNEFDAWLYQNWLMSLIDSLPDIIWYKERSGLHNLVNLQFCDTVHKTREQTRDQGHCYIWNAPPESEFQCAETDNAVMSGGHTVIADEMVETDKGMRQFRTYKSPVRGRDGSIVGTVGLGHDVTDFTNMGMEMQILMDNLPYPVALADGNWRLVSSNERFREAFGFDESQIEGMDYLTWKNSLEVQRVERIGADGTPLHSLDLIAEQNGERHAYEVTEPKILDYFQNVSGYYCIFRDVTVERSYERRTMEFAVTDALTGIANRRGFYLYLNQHVGEPVTIVNLDLDNFKHVNDTYGHAKGDEVLVRIAQIIKEVFPNGHVARQGGDEFACVYEGVGSEEDLQRLKRKLQSRVHAEFDGLNVGLGCSVGMVTTGALSSDVDELLMMADRRMYQNKEEHHATR